jgi:HAD superfamily phosphoserine phosphatase-like hydrolase
MNYKKFPDQYWNEISSTLETLKKTQTPLVAAFDADGTLWDTDLGENFFQFQIDNKQVPLPEDPWKHYLDMKKINGDPRDAYIWLAQINKDIALVTVQEWAQKAFDSIRPSPLFDEQKKLISLLKSHDVKVYIVTASIKWAVEPGARAMGLTADDVIGVETEVKNGLITDVKVLPITYRQGKVDALVHKTNGVKPFLSSGNTIGDYELLQTATHIRLAVSAASRDDKLFKAESELQAKAAEHKWWGHRFI